MSQAGRHYAAKLNTVPKIIVIVYFYAKSSLMDLISTPPVFSGDQLLICVCELFSEQRHLSKNWK